jgi:hypothetical protein
MDGTKLSDLIAQRRTILEQLLEMGSRQIDVIAAGRMSELMSLLAEKQLPLRRLGEISESLRDASGEDPKGRLWESSVAREQCSRDQDKCEQLHIELLAIEAQCEVALGESRESLQQQLGRVDTAQQAATKYASSGAAETMGMRLDLSSD